MKRILLTLLLTLAFAIPSYGAATGPRDVQPEILAMFRAQVADLSDFDPGLCTETGTYELRSTDGVWSCENPSVIASPTFTGQMLGPDGLKTAPTYSFTSDPDTGMFLNATNILRLASAGNDKLEINASAVRMFDEVFLVQGTLAKAAITFGITDANTGLYQATAGDGDVDFTSGGVHAATLNAVGLTLGVDDSATHAALPQYNFGGAETSGMGYNHDGDSVNFTRDGHTKIRLWASYVQFNEDIHILSGTLTDPGLVFQEDNNTGIYQVTSGDYDIDFASNSVHAGTLNATGWKMPDGTVDAPSYAFANDAGMGLYRIGNGRFGWADGGSTLGEFWNGELVLYEKFWAYAASDFTGYANFKDSANIAENLDIGGGLSFYNTTNIGDDQTPNLSDGGSNYTYLADYPGKFTNFSGVANGDHFEIISMVEGVEYECDGTELHCGPGATLTTEVDDVTVWLSKGGDFFLISHTKGSDQLLYPDGTVDIPSYSFSTDPNTGIFLPSEATMQLVSNGSAKLEINEGNLTTYAPIEALNGTAGAPSYSFTSASDLGFFYDASPSIGVSVGGSGIYYFTANYLHTKPIHAENGTAAAPAYTFISDPDTGLFHHASTDNQMYLSVAGNSKIIFTSTYTSFTGNLDIRIPQGTVGRAGMLFVGDVDTGIYQVTDNDNDIDFASGGVHAATLNAVGFVMGQADDTDNHWDTPQFTFAASGDVTDGFGWDNASNYFFVALDGSKRFLSTTNYNQSVVAFRVANGNVEWPTLTSSTDINTGIYYSGSDDNDLHFTSGGVHAATLNAAALTLTGAILTGDGTDTANSISWASDPDTGWYHSVTPNIVYMTAGGDETIEYKPGMVRFIAHTRFSAGALGEPSIAFTGDTNTGIYQKDANDGGIDFVSDAAHIASLGAADGFELVYTTSGTGDTSSYGLTVVATRQGADDYLAGIKVEGRNGGTGGLADLLYLEMMSDSGSFSSGLRIKNAHAANNLALGITVYSAGGSITTAFDASDTEIGAALAIGANNITTAVTTIASTDFDAVFGGAASDADAQHTHTKLLWRTDASILNSQTQACINNNRYGNLNVNTCANRHVTAWTPTHDMTITESVVIMTSIGDVDSRCRLTFIDDNGDDIVGPPVLDFNGDTGAQVIALTDATEFTVTAGDKIRWRVNDQGAADCMGTLDPAVYVELYGYETS